MKLTKRPFRKKIYYSTGMISLVMLPLLCFLFVCSSPRFKQQYAVEINMFVKDSPFGLKLPLRQKQIEIRLTNDSYRDSMILIASRWTIREFKRSRDTSTVIHFYFDDDAPYWTWVEAIDLCKRERVANFIPFENHLWVVNKPKGKLVIQDLRAKNMKPFVCGNQSCVTKEIRKEKRSNRSVFIKENADVLWPASLIFIVMVFASLRRKRSIDPNE